MALTANVEVDHYVDQELRSFPVLCGTHIFKGALVGNEGGYARPLAAGDDFLGIAYEEMRVEEDSRGEGFVRLYTRGDFGVTIEGALLHDLCLPVYALSDDECTFVELRASFVGHCVNVMSKGAIILRLCTFAR